MFCVTVSAYTLALLALSFYSGKVCVWNSSEYLSDVLASVDIKLRAELQGREMSQGDASHHFQVFFAP